MVNVQSDGNALRSIYGI